MLARSPLGRQRDPRPAYRPAGEGFPCCQANEAAASPSIQNMHFLPSRLPSPPLCLAMLAAGLCFLPLRSHAQAAGAYTVTALGSLPETSLNTPWGLSEAGIVAGAAARETGRVAVLWQAGKIKALPGLPGGDSAAVRVNSRGDVAGQVSVGPTDDRAFILTGGKLIRLPKPRGSEREWPAGLNSRGDVCGYGLDAEGTSRACWWPAGAAAAVDLHALLLKLNPKITESRALGINDQGLVVGEAQMGEEAAQAFTSQAGKVTLVSLLGSAQSGAVAVNNTGQAAGWARKEKETRLVLLAAGKAQDLGLLPGCAHMQPTALNGRGEIVGFAEQPNGPERAFLWKPAAGGGKLLDLSALLGPGSRWTVTTPRALNSKGQILTLAQKDGREAALLLTPR